MTDRELMQQALDALINAKGYIFYNVLDDKGNRYDTAIEALRARLAQPEPEPVAWMDSDGFAWTKQGVDCRTTPDTYTPLYTAPPQREWQSLTDEEIDWLWDLAFKAKLNNIPRHFARMVEEKLKEKNT